MARRGGMNDEDARLWSLVAKSVEPLKSTEARLREEARKAALYEAEAPPEKKPKPAAPARKPATRVLPTPDVAPVRTPPEDRRGRVAGLDRRTAERLRKGQYPVEARLDLHGMNQEQAHRALQLFVRQCHAAQKRCLLVITGKGSRQREGEGGPFVNPEPPGILRRRVPQWLGEPDLKPMVLTVSGATPAHGGSGALYILLKRQREA
ncbi:MAG: Smr/MutS family protein [Minwuia sp.]|uniref:Smr/MutS family protein n=1 Tax=Minwuia sp. TaxID=2493630 RepID=UPI003A85B116